MSREILRIDTSSAQCTGCEEQCFMPVHILTDTENRKEAFILCDKRDDTCRVPVKIEALRSLDKKKSYDLS